MTWARLNQLLQLINANGWQLKNPKSMLKIEGYDIYWEIENSEKQRKLELAFYIADYLGRSSKVLKDIQHCEAYDASHKSAQSVRLNFYKIKSEKWKNGLCEFVAALETQFDEP